MLFFFNPYQIMYPSVTKEKKKIEKTKEVSAADKITLVGISIVMIIFFAYVLTVFIENLN